MPMTQFGTVDTIMFVVANAVNLLMIGIFLSRPAGRHRVEHILGLILLALTLPAGAIVIINAANGREWWFVALPALLVVFLAVETILDYIMKLDFRRTRLLGPYLLLYYLALMGMIGYAFLASDLYGFITLATYFLQLGATAYSYRKVGHGRPPADRDEQL